MSLRIVRRGIVMKGLRGERYHASYAILNLLTEESSRGEAPTRIPAIGEQ